MPKTQRNQRHNPSQTDPELDPAQTPEEIQENLAEPAPGKFPEPRDPDEDEDPGDEEAAQADEDDDEDEDDEVQPAPRRRPGRPRGSRSHAQPTFADIVNGPDAGESFWQSHRIIIYRKGISKEAKALLQADNKRTYIDKIAGPFTSEEFDEAYLRAHYGGGVFVCFLQEKGTAARGWEQVLQAEYVIAGAPKYTEEEQKAIRGANPQSATPGGERSEFSVMVDMLQRQIDKADQPQAIAMQTLAESIRTGQQASTEMLLNTMRQVMDLRDSGKGNSETGQLLQMMMAMLEKMALRERAVEPQKTGIQQIEEFVRLQSLINQAQPKPQAGPMDRVAEVLLTRATESILGGDAPARRAPNLEWWQTLLQPLAAKLPELVAGVSGFIAQQAQTRRQMMQDELHARRTLLREQAALRRGEALPPVEEPAPAAQPDAEQQAQAAAARAVTEQFISALTQQYFAQEHPEDAAVTLSAAFPSVVAGLRQQLSPYGKWWTNPAVMGQLGSVYPTLRTVLSHPGFPAWVGQVWGVMESEQQPDGEGAEDEGEMAPKTAIPGNE